MHERLITLASIIRPSLNEEEGFNRAVQAVFPLEVLAFMPLFIVGLVSLVLQTDPLIYTQNALVMLLLLIVMVLFKRFRFLLVTEFQDGMYSIQDNGLEILALWSAALIFGPSILWLELLSTVIVVLFDLPGPVVTKAERWQIGAEALQSMTSALVGTLVGLWLYTQLGGTFPLADPSPIVLGPAFAATLLMIAIAAIIVGIVVPMYTSIISQYTQAETRYIWQMMLRATVVQGFGGVVAIPLALVYPTVGPTFFFIFLLTLVSSSYIAHRLSNALERNRQRTREMQQLERLARAIIEGNPDHQGLRKALQEFIPGMFSFGAVDIRLFPDDHILRHPVTSTRLPEDDWKRLATRRDELLLHEGETLPWQSEPLHYAILYVPIMSEDDDQPVGGLLIRRSVFTDHIEESLAAARSLTAQIASALRREAIYQRTIEYERSARELELAGRIQQRFLSPRLREGGEIGVPGCQLAMYLEPARNMSGDFFDALALDHGHWGFIVADVADKGVAASLYMALSITLLRTYVYQYSKAHPMRPDLVVSEVNERLLEYAPTDQFVTLVLVTLDPITGQCAYANCGHNPPVLLRNGQSHETLPRTGIPLGMMEGWEFSHGNFTLEPGETLVMFSDGVTEAQNPDRALYDDDNRFMDLLTSYRDASAQTLVETIVDDVNRFMAGAPSADDLTLMVLKRDEHSNGVG